MNRPNNMNPMQMIQQFNHFRQQFHGDPKQEVQKMVASGRISQAQLNQFQSMASQFQNMLGMINNK